MTTILWNDRLVKEEEIHLSVEDRGYQFGDGIYEVIKIYSSLMFTVTEHIDRFYESADKIKLVIPYTKDVLHKMLYDLIEDNQIVDGHVYFQITRGSSPRAHAFPTTATEPVFIAYTVAGERPFEHFEQGVKAKFVEDIRWLRCDIKSLNLLGNVLAKETAQQAGCFEAVQHRGDIVTEGSSSNLYGIKDGVLYTHPTTNLILNGITRRVIMSLCVEIGLPVKEESFTTDQAVAMDEFFMSSTSAEVTPIIQIDDYKIGKGTPGEWTRKLQAAFEARIQQLVTF
ncbi:D-amino-acid transaminase [Viridibacillus sp. YIM B01967]|uniref:D-alanine aminotransferase n=1 Tax=Viridibacillus soli TaxID=2798301 RepID=A0ABS1H9H1_9BACL|nr:D-amino-acid transaminase [Viridibacillus soli]MBK3496065.1 D-amino-acid transaminase [Viridibacillus soli]